MYGPGLNTIDILDQLQKTPRYSWKSTGTSTKYIEVHTVEGERQLIKISEITRVKEHNKGPGKTELILGNESVWVTDSYSTITDCMGGL
jgi:hypothetical protein